MVPPHVVVLGAAEGGALEVGVFSLLLVETLRAVKALRSDLRRGGAAGVLGVGMAAACSPVMAQILVA